MKLKKSKIGSKQGDEWKKLAIEMRDMNVILEKCYSRSAPLSLVPWHGTRVCYVYTRMPIGIDVTWSASSFSRVTRLCGIE